MMNKLLKCYIPSRILRKLSIARSELNWYLSSKYWISRIRSSMLKNKHRGQRCFIIGNGPSLNNMDLSLLKDEVTFGMNRIYLMFPKLGWTTTYYVSVNNLVIEQCSHDIETLKTKKFISWHTRDIINFSSDMIFVCDPYDAPLGFSENIQNRVWEGSTVTYVAMQIAYYMGFKQVILIGVDHYFSTKGEPHNEVTSAGNDPNHFSPDYFGQGFRWHLPDLETSEQAYRLARHYYEKDGREILDATIGGQLNVFPKVNYQDLFRA